MADMSKDTRNFDPVYGQGKTAQQIADLAATTGQPGYDKGHPSSVAKPTPTKSVPPSLKPIAPKTYGAPIQAPIVK